jgi:cobalt-zinc-cadmium efflux system protein
LCLLTRSASIMAMKNTPHPQDSHHHQDSHQHEAHQVSAFALPFFLILIFAFIELAGGIWTNSLALLGDAWHMFSDVFSLGLAWFAAHLSAKPGTHKHANGQSHAEIAAAAVNALLMLVVVGYIIYEAIQRFSNPQTISGGYVMLIAFVGLVVNIVVAKMLHAGDTHSHAEDHNRRAAYLHVLSDLLGSVAALVAGAVIYFTGWLTIDPLLSLFISVLILLMTLKLIKDVWHAYRHE